ncbi:unconventional prefoldin RPB5 interactor-like protein [Orussus abietinus]|uniref:unconventional prefoldin RPB5 interactor-like protein n=1 Tax=Orussus abietinus TaxID=222816 RepID=UPI000626EA66|nr:unconventional prefoldin RPB5 interactor-like protein [Orussus abietinus]
MDVQELRSYRTNLLSQALVEGLRRNEEQTKTWAQYRARHKKVIEGLKVLPLELSMNCMMPIGKRALMKAKLVHTNEILVCLGEGYFAKYSAPQAVKLCERRIERADEMLENLRKERDLYETKQLLLFNDDTFESDDKKDVVEHWDEKKLKDWRVQHRQREKEYHEKLSQLKHQQKTEVRTEEDLFHRLDELELQEELEDEINRLEEERSNLYKNDLRDGEVYYESDDDSDDSDSVTEEALKEELARLTEIQTIRSGQNAHSNTKQSEINDSDTLCALEPSANTYGQLKDTNELYTQGMNRILNNDLKTENASNDASNTVGNSKIVTQVCSEKDNVKNIESKRRVSFADLCHTSVDIDTEAKVQIFGKEKCMLQEVCVAKKKAEGSDSDSNEEDIIRINFKHSDNVPKDNINANDVVENPADIYRIFHKPKSILKRSPNDLQYHNDHLLLTESLSDKDEAEDEDEDEDKLITESAYNIVVKDVQEKNPVVKNTVFDKPTADVTERKRPVSKFMMERSKNRR